MSDTLTARGWRRHVPGAAVLYGMGALAAAGLAGGALYVVAPAAVDPEPLEAAQSPAPQRHVTKPPPEPAIPVVANPLLTPDPPDREWLFTQPAVPTSPSAAADGVAKLTTSTYTREAMPGAARQSGLVGSPAVERSGVNFKPAQIEGQDVATLGDLERVIRPFTPIPCTLTGAIDGNRGGHFHCAISRPVRSWGGSTNLLGKQDEATGTYQSLSIGDKRMTAAAGTITGTRGGVGFIIPFGVAPVADALGRAGMPGYVEERGWGERIMNALLTDSAATVARLPQEALRGQVGGLQASTGSTERAINGTVDAAVNQSPVFRKAQGEEIIILVPTTLRFPTLRHEVIR